MVDVDISRDRPIDIFSSQQHFHSVHLSGKLTSKPEGLHLIHFRIIVFRAYFESKVAFRVAITNWYLKAWSRSQRTRSLAAYGGVFARVTSQSWPTTLQSVSHRLSIAHQRILLGMD